MATGGNGQQAMFDACADPWATGPTDGSRSRCLVVLLVSSAAHYVDRRRAIRQTYARALREDVPGGLSEDERSAVVMRFLLGRVPSDADSEALAEEASAHGDMVLTAVQEAYDTLFAKLIAGYRWASQHFEFAYVVHADDDSFVRLERLCSELDHLPRERCCWGYMWNLPGAEGDGRRTRPLRDPGAKSYMPADQWPADSYPPFPSGCCFALSADLVRDWFVRRSALAPGTSGALRFLRLIDVAVGVALSEASVEADVRNHEPSDAVVHFVHAPSVRPYRPLPLFREETTVQHYMRPEEFRAFHCRAYGGGHSARQAAEGPPQSGVGAAAPAAAHNVAASNYSSSADASLSRSVSDDAHIHEVYELLVRSKVLRQ